ncbi:Uncharacterised protein [Prevotella melaninogenica]|uniref:hypothetical protein n=1 Tax=Prevotella melaninogenica TaxID=28132 RepID=UPI001956C646|nr:hypothetical protein [Prevotella melaninogenica]VTY11450.1 Uncharacterised protein [Prevotella melaninogenica]
MKKILLSAVLCLICALQVSAQTFDEEMLEGTWELQTNGVDYNDYIGSINKMEFGYIPAGGDSFVLLNGHIEINWTQKAKDLHMSRFEIKDELSGKRNVRDYYITGKDRLHINVGSFTLHFKILELTANTMKLKMKNDEITYRKVSTSVQNAKVEAPIAEQARYNIKGQKVNHPVKGINIVRMTDNSTRKEVVK